MCYLSFSCMSRWCEWSCRDESPRSPHPTETCCILCSAAWPWLSVSAFKSKPSPSCLSTQHLSRCLGSHLARNQKRLWVLGNFCVSSNLSLPFFWGLSFLFWVKAWLMLPASLTLLRMPGAKELYFCCADQVCLVSCGLFLHISSFYDSEKRQRKQRDCE